MKKTILSSVLLLSLGAVIWWMCANVVWLGDDLDYKYMMKGEIWQSWGKIKDFKGLIESQWIHYLHINGRFVAHFLVQLFNAWFGQGAFAVCDAVFYMLFAFLLSKAGQVSYSNSPSGLLSAICLAVLCFITKMMPTCQIGYIWAMSANIAWLLLFFRHSKPSLSLTIPMVPFGIIVGNWQESVSIGICGGLCIWWLIRLAKSRKCPSVRFEWRRSWMMLGYLAGTALNCLSPSTMGRVGGMTMPLSDQLLIASYSFPAILILLFVCLRARYNKIGIKLFSFSEFDGEIPNGVLFSGMLILIAFNIAIGVYSNRQLFGANLLASILTMRILPHHRFHAAVNALASLAVVAFWILMAQGILNVRRQYDDIVRLHSESADGSVFYDRTRVMTLGFPIRAKYYEDILGLFDNDLHHSMMKDFKHVRKGRTLKLKPAVAPDMEKTVCYAPGHFIVILKEPPKGEAPREILVYGHYPVGIKANPRRIPVTRYSIRSKAYGGAVVIPEFPFFTADSISILPSPSAHY